MRDETTEQQMPIEFAPTIKKPKTGGRKKGSRNVKTRAIERAVRLALHRKGGVKYLETLADQHPTAFASLVGKCMPAEAADDSSARLRYEALKLSGGKCELCGRAPPEVVLHVDHIIPKSKAPELRYEIKNLQVLCGDCNLGKSNRDNTDWRKRK